MFANPSLVGLGTDKPKVRAGADVRMQLRQQYRGRVTTRTRVSNAMSPLIHVDSS